MDEKTLSLDELIKPVIEEFSKIPFNDTIEADNFFIKYGVGNAIYQMDTPFERFLYYEFLLYYLMKKDYEKYQRMHKGIPFYFLAWLSFDIRNYEKALYYIDAAISEDFKNSKSDPLLLPASKFLLLDSKDQVAKRTIDLIYYTLNDELVRFNKISGEILLSKDIFINQFVRPLLKDPRNRTIISAFYVFLLEYYERRRELNMRSTEGGSIAPFIKHLFSGALIFESILKYLFPTKDNKSPVQTLRDIFETSSFLEIYPSKIPISASSLKEILTGVTDNSLFISFSTTSKIRNTTGHNLIWDDTFSNPNSYRVLFEQEVNAILYIIVKSFLPEINAC